MAHCPAFSTLASTHTKHTVILTNHAPTCCRRAAHQRASAQLYSAEQQLLLRTTSRQHLWQVQAQRDERGAQTEEARLKAPGTPPSKMSQQQSPSSPQQQQPQQEWWRSTLAGLQDKWQQLDLPQKAYTVVLGMVLLAAIPKVLTLLVLLLERVLVGGLLALEEVLLQLLLKGGALLGVLGALALLGAGVYVFARKTVK